MPIVTESTLVGNAGAYHVASLLSQACLVRPVASDTDVGVDLYCETVREDRPFLHFWVQVKSGTTQVRVLDDGARASCSLEKRHIKYWSNQPVPVFGALVADPLARGEDRSTYFVDITGNIVLRGLPTAASVTLRSFLKLEHGDRPGLERFVYGVVERSTAVWRLRQHGVVSAIPTLDPEYWRQYPPMPVVEYQSHVVGQIGTTAAMTIIQAFLQGRIQEIDAKSRRSLGTLAESRDVNHWENPMAAAISLHFDSDFARALCCYEAARDCIRRDPNTRERPEWQEKLDLIGYLSGLAQDEAAIRLPEEAPPNYAADGFMVGFPECRSPRIASLTSSW